MAEVKKPGLKKAGPVGEGTAEATNLELVERMLSEVMARMLEGEGKAPVSDFVKLIELRAELQMAAKRERSGDQGLNVSWMDDLRESPED